MERGGREKGGGGGGAVMSYELEECCVHTVELRK